MKGNGGEKEEVSAKMKGNGGIKEMEDSKDGELKSWKRWRREKKKAEKWWPEIDGEEKLMGIGDMKENIHQTGKCFFCIRKKMTLLLTLEKKTSNLVKAFKF